MSRQQLKKYIWLIDTIRTAGESGITYEEINGRWLDSWKNDLGKPLPWRTFQDDRDAIDELFGIRITCDRRNNTYRIGETVSEYGSVKDTLIDALVLNSAIRETPDLNNCIVFSRNFHQRCMPELVKAIKDHTTVRFRHVRHDRIPSGGPSPDYDHVVTFQPYGLYNNCLWFTVGRNLSDGKIHIYTLHRIFDIEFTEERFTVPEDFNVKQYMTDFWVDDGDLEPEREPDDAFALESFEAGKGLDLKV